MIRIEVETRQYPAEVTRAFMNMVNNWVLNSAFAPDEENDNDPRAWPEVFVLQHPNNVDWQHWREAEYDEHLLPVGCAFTEEPNGNYEMLFWDPVTKQVHGEEGWDDPSTRRDEDYEVFYKGEFTNRRREQ